MYKNEAAQLASSKRDGDGHAKPKADQPDSRDMRDQLIEREWKTFKENLATAAFVYEKTHDRWPKNQWFDDHMGFFQRRMDREYPDNPSTGSPPCKNWSTRVAMDSTMLGVLEGVWAVMLPGWARTHAYLGSPSAVCQCGVCT